MEIKRELIIFEYANDLLPNSEREQAMIININHWLDNFKEEINNQDGTINVFFSSDTKTDQHLSFNGMNDDLTFRLYQHMQTFAYPNILHRWNR